MTATELSSTLATVVDPGRGLAPPGAEGIITIVQWVAWTVLAVCVLGVLLVGARMALAHRRGEGAEHAVGLAYVLGGAVLVGSASGLVAALV
jgi:hypothetical protein